MVLVGRVMFRGSIAIVACDGVKDACKRCKSGANMANDIALEVAERNVDNVQHDIIVASTKIRHYHPHVKFGLLLVRKALFVKRPMQS